MTEEKSGAAPGASGCVCMGTGPVVTNLLKSLGPDESVRQHFRNARVEFLKGLRAIIDQQISDLQKPAQQKGAKLSVD